MQNPDLPPADANSAPSNSSPRGALDAQHDDTSRRSVRWVMGLIIAWGVIAALGVLRYDYLHDQLNLVKPFVVIACTLVVVVGWQLALRRRLARR